jgi:hypothetical protein
VGLRVFVPISNYFVGLVAQNNPDVAGQIQAMVREIYGGGTTPHAAAGLWSIGNEYDLAQGLGITADTIAQTAALIVQAEDQLGIPSAQRLPITSPVSFAVFNNLPPAIDAVQRLQQAFQNNSTLSATQCWDTRFIAALNSFNTGDFLKEYIDTTFPHYFPALPFFLGEMGISVQNCTPPTEEQQATFVAAQLAQTAPRANFMGTCVFQFLNQSALKQGSEAAFGLTKYAGGQQTQGTIPPGYTPGGGQSYPVDTLARKPLFATVAKAYQ